MKRNSKFYGLLGCNGRDTICPHCGTPYDSEETISECPDCGGKVIIPDAAISGLPYIGSKLYFYNSSATAFITGYIFTETDVLVEWESLEPIYDNKEKQTYGCFSINFLNSVVFLDKDDVPQEKYELQKLYCNVKTNLPEINSCEDLPQLEEDALVYEGETFYSLDEAKAALKDKFAEIGSEYCEVESGNGIYAYKISYLEIVKILEEIPEFDSFKLTTETLVNAIKPVKAE